MITRQEMSAVLAKCAAYDAAHTPVPSDIVLDAWCEHFGLYSKVMFADVMNSVTEYHTVHHDLMIQPADLSRLARNLAIDRYEHSQHDSEERREHEALCDSKAAPELRAIEGARQRAIEGYARRFGIARAEAEVRMMRERVERNRVDATAIEVSHRRMERPARPVPCPDCGSVHPCEHDVEENADEIG